jgi:bacterial regulatory helix-turn-helix proteins, araC family
MSLWTLGIVVQGSRSIEVQGIQISVKRGEYFLLPPGVLQRGVEEEWHDVYYFHFNMDCKKVDKIEKCQRGKMWISLSGKLPVDIDIISLVVTWHRDFKLQYLSSDTLKAYLASILYSLSVASMKKQYSKNRNSMVAEQILQCVVDHIEKKHSALEFETSFGMSYRRLNSIFKDRYGITIHQCVLEKKMQHALHLLIMGENIANVASACGFEDYFYFLKVFKKIYGMTPKDCQRQYFTDNNQTNC